MGKGGEAGLYLPAQGTLGQIDGEGWRGWLVLTCTRHTGPD